MTASPIHQTVTHHEGLIEGEHDNQLDAHELR